MDCKSLNFNLEFKILSQKTESRYLLLPEHAWKFDAFKVGSVISELGNAFKFGLIRIVHRFFFCSSVRQFMSLLTTRVDEMKCSAFQEVGAVKTRRHATNQMHRAMELYAT